MKKQPKRELTVADPEFHTSYWTPERVERNNQEVAIRGLQARIAEKRKEIIDLEFQVEQAEIRLQRMDRKAA
jgi:hypothetical protein